MTRNEITRMSQEQLLNLPWDFHGIVFFPGRYYLGLAYLEIPFCSTCPIGGNIVAQMWRFETEPTTWTITFRFRRYEAPGGVATDRRFWYATRFIGEGDEKAESDFRQFLAEMKCVTELNSGPTEPPELLIFKADWARSYAMIEEAKPYWFSVEKPA